MSETPRTYEEQVVQQKSFSRGVAWIGKLLQPHPKGSPCWQCGVPSDREFCFAAEPWQPYCTKHPPMYETAGDRALLPRRDVA